MKWKNTFEAATQRWWNSQWICLWACWGKYNFKCKQYWVLAVAESKLRQVESLSYGQVFRPLEHLPTMIATWARVRLWALSQGTFWNGFSYVWRTACPTAPQITKNQAEKQCVLAKCFVNCTDRYWQKWDGDWQREQKDCNSLDLGTGCPQHLSWGKRYG